MLGINRREFIASVGTGTVIATAGCTGNSDDSGSDDSGSDGSGTDGSTPDGSGSDGEPVTIRLNEFGHENHTNYLNVALPFKEKVENRSNITIEVFADSQLGSPTNNVGHLESGAADMASILTPYEAESVPISALPTVPGIFNDVEEAAGRYYDLAVNNLADVEFAQYGIKPIFTGLTPMYQVATVEPKVDSREDWNGTTLRSSSGYHSAAIEAMGGNPARLSGAEQYQAMERGTVDGSCVAIPQSRSQRLNELINYITDNLNMGAFPVTYGLREGKFGNMTDSQQEVVMNAGREVTEESIGVFLQEEQDTVEQYESNGIEVFSLPTDTRDDWQNMMNKASMQVWLETVEHENPQQFVEILEE